MEKERQNVKFLRIQGNMYPPRWEATTFKAHWLNAILRLCHLRTFFLSSRTNNGWLKQLIIYLFFSFAFDFEGGFAQFIFPKRDLCDRTTAAILMETSLFNLFSHPRYLFLMNYNFFFLWSSRTISKDGMVNHLTATIAQQEVVPAL